MRYGIFKCEPLRGHLPCTLLLHIVLYTYLCTNFCIRKNIYVHAFLYTYIYMYVQYIRIHNAPALPACNWSKARLVPPLGWTNGYAQAKANPCASSSTTIATSFSTSNNVLLLPVKRRSSPRTLARREKMRKLLSLAIRILHWSLARSTAYRSSCVIRVRILNYWSGIAISIYCIRRTRANAR